MCTGKLMSDIHFDFSPKGGPADLIGIWFAPDRTITWPGGNTWKKVSDAAKSLAERPSASAGFRQMAVLLGVSVVAVAAITQYARRRQQRADVTYAAPI